MSRVLVVATAGAGGDLQPLVALALELETEGHQVIVLGDKTVADSLVGLPITSSVLPSEYDLGPRLAAAATTRHEMPVTARSGRRDGTRRYPRAVERIRSNRRSRVGQSALPAA